MAERVIDLFRVIDIYHHNAERRVVFMSFRDCRINELIEMAAVWKRCQRVQCRKLFDLHKFAPQSKRLGLCVFEFCPKRFRLVLPLGADGN